jgi:hypothetical protein
MRDLRIRLLCVCGISAGVLLAADPAWKTKPTAEWSEQDAVEILTASPWARQVMAGIAGRQSEDELREGGKMGQPTGIGYDGVDPKGTGPKLPTKLSDLVVPAPNGGRSVRSMAQGLPVRLRWESALPVRLAELKARQSDPPTLEGDGYRIAVYGLPGGYFKGDPQKLGDPLKDYAVLRREGKKDVKPLRVEVFPQSDGWAVVYLFPLSAEISPRDGKVTFDAHIGRIGVTQMFDLTQMVFQGKLEI